MWNLSGVKVEAASKEAEGVLASDSGAFKHNTLPHKCFQETEQPSEIDVYLIPKYTFRLLGYVYEVVSTYECGVHISLSPIATLCATD